MQDSQMHSGFTPRSTPEAAVAVLLLILTLQIIAAPLSQAQTLTVLHSWGVSEKSPCLLPIRSRPNSKAALIFSEGSHSSESFGRRTSQCTDAGNLQLHSSAPSRW